MTAVSLDQWIKDALRGHCDDDLVKFVICNTEDFLLSKQVSSLSAKERIELSAKLPVSARFALEINPLADGLLMEPKQDSVVRMLIYRYRNFLLESLVYEEDGTSCFVVAKASGCARYKLESALKTCRDTNNYEKLTNFIRATVDPDLINPSESAYLPELLDFATIAEKDMDEQEVIGICFVSDSDCAYIDIEDFGISELIDGTERLLQITSNPDQLKQILANQNSEEIDDLLDELNEAMDDDRSHDLFSIDDISEALEIDMSDGWRWSSYIQGDMTPAIMMSIINNLSSIKCAATDEDYCDGFEILDLETPAGALLRARKKIDSMFTWNIEDACIS
jgi:hypothetical protein